MKKILITTPIYYVNDKPHWGHAYTTVAADVLARFFSLQGNDVFFLTGTDEHGLKVAESAERLNKTPKELCDENSEAYKFTWKNLGIEYNHFIRTTDKIHEERVIEFLKTLKDKGAVYEKEYEGMYCVECEKFLTEKDLIDGKCPDHKTEPKKVSERNYFFKLKNYLKEVEKKILSAELLIQPEAAKKEVLGLLKQELEDFSISRQKEKVRWGIDLPFGKSQTIYVWVDALLNYYTGNGTKEFAEYWEKGEVVHLLGKDILKFHAIFWPAMLLAASKKIPKREFIHGFFTIDGQKMSKTLGNVIDPNEVVGKFGVDGARYLLLSQFPFGQDGDVKKEKFAEKYNADLANGLGNLVARVLALANKHNIKSDKPDKETKKKAEEVRDTYRQWMENFKLFETLEEVWRFIGWCDKYIEENKPWQVTDEDKLEQILSNLLYCVSEISDLIAPLLPQTSKKVKNQLRTGKPEILFPRINK